MQFFNYPFLPIGNFTKSFCGFTSRKAVFAREEALRIANTDRARWHGNAVAFVYESHDQRLPHPSQLPCPGHAKVTKIIDRTSMHPEENGAVVDRFA